MIRSRHLKSLLLILLLTLGSNCNKDKPTEPGYIVELQEIDDVLPNPFKGFAPWIGERNSVYDLKLHQATFGWADLEPEKGDYKWSQLERNWGNVARTGKRVGFRIAAEIPGSGKNDTPQWLIDQGVQMRPYSIDGHDGLAPDWDDPKFLSAHHDFIMALGARYDEDPRVAWIDIGSYGFWGEWQIWLNPDLAGTQATKKAIIDDYFDAFPSKRKVIAFDDDFALSYVTGKGGGIRNDCLGTADNNAWYVTSLDGISPDLRRNVWKRAIITGEFCTSEGGALAGTTTRWDLNFQFIKDNHWSFIGPSGGSIEPLDDEHRANLDLLHNTLGYRFVLRSVKFDGRSIDGQHLQFQIAVENKGVAPFYFDWPLTAYLVAEDGNVALQADTGVDIRDWLPGMNTSFADVDISSNVSPGEYDVKLAIRDPLTNLPGVLFANAGRDSLDRYHLSKITID